MPLNATVSEDDFKVEFSDANPPLWPKEWLLDFEIEELGIA